MAVCVGVLDCLIYYETEYYSTLTGTSDLDASSTVFAFGLMISVQLLFGSYWRTTLFWNLHFYFDLAADLWPLLGAVVFNLGSDSRKQSQHICTIDLAVALVGCKHDLLTAVSFTVTSQCCCAAGDWALVWRLQTVVCLPLCWRHSIFVLLKWLLFYGRVTTAASWVAGWAGDYFTATPVIKWITRYTLILYHVAKKCVTASDAPIA